MSAPYSYNCRLLSENAWALGPVENKTLSSSESTLISKYFGTQTLTSVPTFKRLKKEDNIYFCSQYLRVKCRNSYTVVYSDTLYGHISFFVLYNNKPAAVIKKLEKLPASDRFLPLVPVKVTSDFDIISIGAITEKCVFIQTSQNCCCVGKFPCNINTD